MKEQKIARTVEEANALAKQGWMVIDIKCYLLNTTTALNLPHSTSGFSLSDLYTGGVVERVFILLERPIN